MVTPLSTREFMLEKMTPPAILAFGAGLIVIGLSVAWFRVSFRGESAVPYGGNGAVHYLRFGVRAADLVGGAFAELRQGRLPVL